jgi:hypothetical protein
MGVEAMTKLGVHLPQAGRLGALTYPGERPAIPHQLAVF